MDREKILQHEIEKLQKLYTKLKNQMEKETELENKKSIWNMMEQLHEDIWEFDKLLKKTKTKKEGGKSTSTKKTTKKTKTVKPKKTKNTKNEQMGAGKLSSLLPSFRKTKVVTYKDEFGVEKKAKVPLSVRVLPLQEISPSFKTEKPVPVPRKKKPSKNMEIIKSSTTLELPPRIQSLKPKKPVLPRIKSLRKIDKDTNEKFPTIKRSKSFANLTKF